MDSIARIVCLSRYFFVLPHRRALTTLHAVVCFVGFLPRDRSSVVFLALFLLPSVIAGLRH